MIPSRCRADRPPTSAETRSIAFGNAMDATFSALAHYGIDGGLQTLAILPECATRAPLVTVNPLARYTPTAPVPTAIVSGSKDAPAVAAAAVTAIEMRAIVAADFIRE